LKTTRVTAFLTLMLCMSACDQPQIGEFNFPEGTLQHAVISDEIEWKPCPPNLPPDCEIAVLEGNPQAPGLFTLRFRVNSDFFMPPHTHPKDERVTVISGQMSVAFGADASHEDAKQFRSGDYYVNARGAVHLVWADESTEIQITGFGPWEAHFVE
jgi:quercetin dioxygenase-like cupin family protein